LSRITFTMKLKPINECLSMFPSIDVTYLQDYITICTAGFRTRNLRNYFFKLTFSRTSYQIPGHFHDFPGQCSDSRTFQGLENSLTKFQDFP
jgi:hypothetical protein